MKKIILFLFVVISLPLVAQNNTTDDFKFDKKNTLKPDTLALENNKSYFKAQLSYTSNYSFYGRTDTKTVPYMAPLFGYFNKSGFYVTTSLYYSLINNSKAEVYFFDIGYDHQVADNMTIGIFGNKTSYNKNSDLMASSIKEITGGYLDYDFNYFEITLESELMFGKKTDFTFTPTIYKEFNVLKNKNLKITPTFSANFSSLNYYEDFSNKKLKKLSSTATTTVETIVDNKKFTLLDYEFSVPLEYKIGKITYFATPMFAFPKNPVHTTSIYTFHNANGTQVGNPVKVNSTEPSELKLKNSFFIELGLNYKF